jgi:translation initiation factor 2 subunit 3
MKNIIIDVIGSFSDGKTTLVKALTNELTLRHSEELKYGMTIRLGYAHFTIYKDKNSFSLSEGEPYMNVSIIDSPGHKQLVSIMISGASFVDGAILVVAANKKCPQPQTAEHLDTIKKIGIKNLVVAQTKTDLVPRERAIESYWEIRNFLDKNGYTNAKIIPVFAQQSVNIEKIVEEIAKFEPLREEGDLIMPIVRSFDINKPGTPIEELKGGVIGGGIKRGKLKVGDEIKIIPGIAYKGKIEPLYSIVESIQSEFGEEKEIGRGKTIGVLTKLDPALAKEDGLAGNIAVHKDAKIEKTKSITIEITDPVTFSPGEQVLVHLFSMRFLGNVTSFNNNKLTIAFQDYMPYFKNELVLVSKKINNVWTLSTSGKCE